VRSTAYRRPLRLIYYEGCLWADDVRRRERYLKTGRGGRYLKQRLASWLSEIRSNKLERH
jgi:putative endonuclease